MNQELYRLSEQPDGAGRRGLQHPFMSLVQYIHRLLNAAVWFRHQLDARVITDEEAIHHRDIGQRFGEHIQIGLHQTAVKIIAALHDTDKGVRRVQVKAAFLNVIAVIVHQNIRMPLPA